MTNESPRGPRLRIVAVNDVYLLDGFPSLAGLIAHARTHDPADALLVTLAGDFVAPSLLSSLDAGAAMVDCINAVGFTHVCFGNHEDDIEPHELRDRVRELEPKCLGTNIRGFDPELPLHDIVEVSTPAGDAVKVGIVGVVMHDRSVYRRDPFGGVTLLPANDAALAERAKLRGLGCAHVIALTHQPIGEDRALAAALPEGEAFPVLLAGHEHQVFVETIGGTTIVKASADAVRAAIVDLEWSTPEALAPKVTVVLHDVHKYPEDPAIRTRVDHHNKAVTELSEATLLVLPEGAELSSVGTRIRQTTMGTLLATRVRAALGADACVFNGGGIRAAKRYETCFSYGDLQAEVPFENEIVVVELPGGVLSEAVRVSRAKVPVESGGFLQVCDNLRVGDDGRIVEALGAPLDETKSYRVALVRNLFLGMDHNAPLVAFARDFPERIPPSGCGRDVKLVLLESFAQNLWGKLGGFAAVDRDHDGRVSHAELETAITEYTKRPPSNVAAGIVLRALDANHDEVVSPEEASSADEKERPKPR